MSGKTLWKKVFQKSHTAVLLALIFPFLAVGTSTQVAYAADTPNFKIHIENSVSSKVNRFYIFNEMAKVKTVLNFDSSGNISTTLSNGTYVGVLFPNQDEGSSRTSSNYKFTISGGVVTSFKKVNNYLNTSPEETNVALNGSNYYRMYLGTTGFRLSMTVGGETKTVMVNSILGANKYSKPINPTYFESGTVVVDIDPGTYTVYGSDMNGSDAGTTSCTVTANAISECTIRLSGPNFKYRISTATGESVTAPREIYTTFEQVDSNNKYINSWGVNGLEAGSQSLQDGIYNLRIFKSYIDQKTGQNSSFRILVSGGEVTEVKSLDSSETMTASSGRFTLKLRAENFKILATANGSPVTNYYLYGWNSKTGNSAWAYADADGRISTNLSEGENQIYLSPNSNNIDYVSTRLIVTVLNGLVNEVRTTKGDTITAASGQYTIPFLVANVKGTLTLGGTATTGYVSSIYEKTLNRWVDVNANYIYSEGKYGIALERGSYKIAISPSYPNQDGAYLYVDCDVPATGTTTCDLAAPAKNFTFEIWNTSDTKVVTNQVAQLTRLNAYPNSSQTQWMYNYGGATYSVALQDGQYTLVAHSNNMNRDGQDKKYTVTFAGGVVTRVQDDKTEDVVQAVNGVYRLKLATPNFQAILRANGAPNPNAWSNAYQPGFNSLGSSADADGKVAYDLPNGINEVRIYTTGNESPTVVSAKFTVVVESSTVKSVSNLSGDTLTATSGVYSLDYLIPNLVGQMTVNGEPARGYVQGVWNSVLNKSVDFGGNGIDQNGNYSFLVPAGNYDVLFVPYGGVGGAQNCNATAGVRTICNINFPAKNFGFSVKNFNGTVLTSGISGTITRRFTKGQSFPGQSYGFGIPYSAQGLFESSLVDGIYELQIQSNLPIEDGDSRRFSFKVESGTVSNLKDLETGLEIDTATARAGITLIRPNFQAVIKANNVAVNGAYIYAYSISDKGNFGKSIGADSQGRISFKVPDGEYRLYAHPRGDESPLVVRTWITFNVESETVVSATYSDGSAVSVSGGVYTINLATPNLTGTYTYGGESAAGVDINFYGIYSTDTQRYVDYDFASNGNGGYGVKIAPGNYIFSLGRYSKPGVLQLCTVSETASVCNFDVAKDNFTFKIQSSSGLDLPEDVGASGSIRMSSSNYGFWFAPSVGGLFKAGLKIPSGISADYEFYVYTTDGSNRHGIPRRYKVTMNGESITAVTDMVTGLNVNAGSDGIYAFRLSAPNLAGTVVGTDGSTPIPNSSVQADGPIRYGLSTDNSGAFSALLEQDGSYSVWAMAPQYDITKADSAKTSVTISNGSGNTNLQLRLRAPTVQGTVSGPTGVSPYNYIEVLKKNDDGYFDYYGYNARARSTNTQGKFAFYLDPGIYKFQTQADEENAGGGRTVSTECVVTDTSTVINCSIVLASSNVKVKVLGEGGTPYQNGHVYFNYIGDKNGIAERPVKTWDYGYMDPQGKLKVSLENGTWQGNVQIYGSGNESPLQFTVEIESGTVRSITYASGETATADSSGYFPLQLPVANLTGTILDAGKRIDFGANVEIWQQGEDGNGYSEGRWVNGGKFAFSAKPGKYTITVYPYVWRNFSINSPVRTQRFDCEVPMTGSVTCDVNLKTGNFNGKIVTPAGSLFSQSHAYILRQTENENGDKYYDWSEGTNVINGQFSSYLETGTYQVHVYPYWNATGSFTRNRFEVVVSAGVIQSVLNMSTRETVTASNSQYSLALSSPTVAGQVLKSGSGATAAKWSEVIPVDVATGEELWEFATGTNEQGKFAMSLPNGTYDIFARQWGGKGDEGTGFTSSAKYRVTVAAGVGNTNMQIRMRDPNFSLRVVSPTNSAQGLADVWVHGNFNNQYFGGTTDSNGYFTAFVDTTTASTCQSSCRVYVYPNNQNSYTPRSETFTTVGNIGNVAVGVVNAIVKIYIPTNGVVGMPNKWSWFSVEELNPSGEVLSENGYGTNELGQAGIGLTSGGKYRITAYPSGEYYGRYAPKSVMIDSFNPSTQGTISITFDSPNITFIVRDSFDVGNAWGWFEVFSMSGATATRFVDGYLNDQGRGALYLPDGDYKFVFYPGRSKGVEKTVTVTMSSGHVTSSSGATFVNDLSTIIMGAGNVTGLIRNSAGDAAANIAVTAVSTTGSASKVVTITKEDGTFELNLNTDQSWTINALDPITLNKGSVAVVANSGSYTGKNINLTP
jgi:hypothetical protein